MANMNQNGSSGLRGPGAVVCDYHKKTKDDKSAAESRRTAANTKQSFKDIERGYKLCCLETAEYTYDYYRNMDNFELFDMFKSTEIIQKNIDGYIKKNDEVEKIILDASKLLNDIEIKLHDAHNAACAMSNCIKSHVDIPENGESTDPVFDDSGEITDLKDALKAVLETAKQHDMDSRDAAEAIAKIAGIQTFSNIDSLKDFGKSLGEKTKSFKGMVDGFIKGSTDEIKAVQAELTKVLEELNIYEFKFFEEDMEFNRHNEVIKFICFGECQPVGRVEKICSEMGSVEPQQTGVSIRTNPSGSKGERHRQNDKD